MGTQGIQEHKALVLPLQMMKTITASWLSALPRLSHTPSVGSKKELAQSALNRHIHMYENNAQH